MGEVAAGKDVQRLAGQQVYVLDAHSLIYQVFHARGEMSGPHGQPVGAIDGVLARYLDDPRPARARLSAMRLRPTGKDFSPPSLRSIQSEPSVDAGRSAAADPQHSKVPGGAGDSRADRARLRGGRCAGDRCPPGRAAGGRMLSGNQRQGLLPADNGSRQDFQHPASERS